MKKLPMLLLTLTLFGMIQGARPVYADGAEDGVSEEAPGEILVTNYYDPRVTWQKLDMTDRGWMTLKFNYKDDEGRKPTRVLMVAYKYRKLTETEADGYGAVLGEEEDESWAQLRVNQPLSGVSGTSSATVKTGYNWLRYNFPDIIYYAVEFTATGVESVWVRGKIDYRPCAHNSSRANIPVAEQTCLITADADEKRYSFALKNATNPDEEVPDWDEEIYAAVEDDLAGLINQVKPLYEKMEAGEEVTPTEAANAEYSVKQQTKSYRSMKLWTRPQFEEVLELWNRRMTQVVAYANGLPDPYAPKPEPEPEPEPEPVPEPDPVVPVVPVTPAEPVDPEPEVPIIPMEPEIPEEPEIPVIPTEQEEPEEPETSEKPETPVIGSTSAGARPVITEVVKEEEKLEVVGVVEEKPMVATEVAEKPVLAAVGVVADVLVEDTVTGEEGENEAKEQETEVEVPNLGGERAPLWAWAVLGVTGVGAALLAKLALLKRRKNDERGAE